MDIIICFTAGGTTYRTQE